MTDGFKQSLTQINNLMWVALSLSFSLLLLDFSKPDLTILGISVSSTRILIVGPIALVCIFLMRQLYIKNLIEIINRNDQKTELKEIVLAYPLIEFMRWRFKFGAELALLTAAQVIFEMVPAISLTVLWFILRGRGTQALTVLLVADVTLIFLALWNYNSLRRGVFETLVGKIGTVD